MADVVLSLPDELRDDLKEPRGPVFTDPTALLAEVGRPLVAVGDVVTYHLEEAGGRPDVALVDGRTEREPAKGPVGRLAESGDIHVENPAATLTADLLVALRDGLDADDRVLIVVDGEEDLAAVPALAVVPPGGSVVYGQPGAGMIHVAVTETVRSWARDFLRRMDGDPERALALLGS